MTFVAAFLLTACGHPRERPSMRPALAAASLPSSPRPVTSMIAAPTCLPLVSGCGCAYVCAHVVRRAPDGAFEVSHDFQDSRLDRVQLERWCFDAAGHGSPARGAPAAATRCMDVFFDGTPCGGECIPQTATLHCVEENGRCHAAGMP